MANNVSETINQSLTGLFFLYFVLMSGELTSLLNCGIQRFLKNSLILKHILIFFSIFIFTFILKWYTLSSLVVKEGMGDADYNYINKSLFFSCVIYALFLLTSKMETIYLFIFLILLVISFLMYLFYKLHLGAAKTELLEKSGLFVSAELKNKILDESESERDATIAITLKNTMAVLYLIMILLIIIGFLTYYSRQRQEHAKKWNFITFLFGNNRCEHV